MDQSENRFYRTKADQESTMKAAGNADAWAVGQMLHGRFHVRRVVWGRLHARHERRLDEVIRKARVLVAEGKGRGKKNKAAAR